MHSVKISDEAYNLLKSIAEKSGRSIRDVIENAIQIAYRGSEDVIEKELKGIKQGFISVKYPTRCSICKRKIKEGELAYWIKYEFTDKSVKTKVICLECYYKDEAIAKYYIKKKELEAIVRGLRKEADRLAEEVKTLEVKKELNEVKREVVTFWREFKYLLAHNQIEQINEIIPKLDDVLNRIYDIESALKVLMNGRKLKVKEEDYLRVKAHHRTP